MRLYDYVDARGRNIIREWTDGLQARDRAKLRNKLKMLEKVADPALLPQLLAGPRIQGEPEIYKLQVGRSGSENALRPMLCRGPFDKNEELTLLVGATERDGKLPKGVAKVAEQNRRDILADPNRRRPHEYPEDRAQAKGEANTS